MSETFSKVEVITGVARRRRFTTEQKLLVVNETLQPGMSPSAPAISSVSTSLDRAGGTSAGRSKKNSTAFGTPRLWTSARVDEGSFCRTRTGWVVGSGAFAGNRPPPD
jgi:hypothetical protein